MQEGVGKIAAGLVLLVALWIGVYWWWPSGSKITFAQGDDAIRGVTPKQNGPAGKPDSAPATTPDPAPPVSEKPVEKPIERPTAPPVVVIPPRFTEYTVQDGDTFATIAKKTLGSESLAPAIAAANPLISPPTLKAGRVIKIPVDPANIQGQPIAQQPDKPAEDKMSEYTVQPGDSLSRIAQEVYGDSRLASLIFEANKDQLVSEHAIKVGQRLKIPARPQR